MRFEEDAAVSSVVGTVLVLAITIAVFGGLSVVVVDYFAEQQQTLRADLSVQESSGTYLLVHKGGERVPLNASSALVNVGGNDTVVPLSYFSSQAGPDWNLGETLCIAGNDAGCRFPAGTDVRGVAVVVASELLLQDGERGAGGA